MIYTIRCRRGHCGARFQTDDRDPLIDPRESAEGLAAKASSHGWAQEGPGWLCPFDAPKAEAMPQAEFSIDEVKAIAAQVMHDKLKEMLPRAANLAGISGVEQPALTYLQMAMVESFHPEETADATAPPPFGGLLIPDPPFAEIAAQAAKEEIKCLMYQLTGYLSTLNGSYSAADLFEAMLRCSDTYQPGTGPERTTDARSTGSASGPGEECPSQGSNAHGPGQPDSDSLDGASGDRATKDREEPF